MTEAQSESLLQMATALITSKTKKRTIVLGGFGGADSDWTSVTELLVSPEELARSLFAALQGRGCKSPKEVDKINRLADACLNTVDKKVNETRQDERRKVCAIYDEYIQLLVDDLAEMVGRAAAHGWKSHRIEQEETCRKEIARLRGSPEVAVATKPRHYGLPANAKERRM